MAQTRANGPMGAGQMVDRWGLGPMGTPWGPKTDTFESICALLNVLVHREFTSLRMPGS